MMDMKFSLIRDGVTATSISMSLVPLDPIRRWVVASLRLSGVDASRYKFMGFSDLADVSDTDRLEELTGGVTGSVFTIVNKREVTGSHLELDLGVHDASTSD